ncbi:MAG: outer membrane lipid asymmetry maintenance protein MlaD [Alphaproteobacteria bacterium]|nr:MAG: outer membrane lipid asymmetry maintenance protein MlaD [Alphaproteobacteria bacterium]
MSQHQNTIEAVLGAVVLAAAAMFLWFAYTMADLRSESGYDVSARFDKIGGLKIGSDVRLSGIKVGTISGLSLDDKNFMANVRMTIQENIHLPSDTVAEVASEGLLGGNYLSLVPGSEDQTIPAGGQIKYTQSPVDLVQLLGRFIFSGADKAKEETTTAHPGASAN